MLRNWRINRVTYWAGLGLILAIYVALNFLSSKQVAVSEGVLMFLCIPRLHDIGKSGWWVGGVFFLEIAVVVISLSILPLKTALIPLGIFTFIVAGLLVWLGTIPGQPDANRFGDPPAPGFGLNATKKTPLP